MKREHSAEAEGSLFTFQSLISHGNSIFYARQSHRLRMREQMQYVLNYHVTGLVRLLFVRSAYLHRWSPINPWMTEVLEHAYGGY